MVHSPALELSGSVFWSTQLISIVATRYLIQEDHNNADIYVQLGIFQKEGFFFRFFALQMKNWAMDIHQFVQDHVTMNCGIS